MNDSFFVFPILAFSLAASAADIPSMSVSHSWTDCAVRISSSAGAALMMEDLGYMNDLEGSFFIHHTTELIGPPTPINVVELHGGSNDFFQVQSISRVAENRMEYYISLLGGTGTLLGERVRVISGESTAVHGTGKRLEIMKEKAGSSYRIQCYYDAGIESRCNVRIQDSI